MIDGAVKDISAMVAAVHQAHPDLPGLVGALVEGDRVTAAGAAGVRKVGERERMTPDDVIHLGSCTKAMTATLIGQLIDGQKLAMTTSLAEIFPELMPQMSPTAAKVTVADLLRHTAGIPENCDWRSVDQTNKPIMQQRRMVVEEVLNATAIHPPGTHFAYSNVGYVILGAILEADAGKPWEEIIQARLFAPLGMSSAGFGPPGSPSQLGTMDHPWGHTREGEAIRALQVDNPPVLGPAGRVHCTLSDWARFVALYLQATPRQSEVLSSATRELLITTGPVGNYAGGWGRVVRDWGVVGHFESLGL